jgi:hypothetical protein
MLSDPGPGLPYFSPITIPALPSLALSDKEREMISLLQTRQWRNRAMMMLTDSYYRGMQLITDLGIAIPPELSGLRTLVGWPRIAIDPLLYRLSAEGFRLAGATDSDSDLSDLWFANRMRAEQTLAFKDALVKGRGYLTVGSPLETGDFPVICVESPLNMAVLWDVRSLKPKSALQTYWVDNQQHAALYTPDQTVHIGRDDVTNEWEITDRDQHNFGLVPIVRMANEPESDRRDGMSEITAEVMSITDAACRTLLGLEVAREFYSVPQKYILGATESDFMNADGTPKPSWSTYISRIIAIEANEEGDVPTVGQFKAHDPSVFTKIIEMYASQMAGVLGAPPQDLGLYTQGNPVSADAQQVSESRRDRYARHKQNIFEAPLVETMQIALRFMNQGDLPQEFRRMEVDWMAPEMLNLAAVSDALTKQAKEGMVPPRSDVVLKRAGYSAVERARLEQDFKVDEAAQVLAELANSEQVKQVRAVNTVDSNVHATTPPKPASDSAPSSSGK